MPLAAGALAGRVSAGHIPFHQGTAQNLRYRREEFGQTLAALAQGQRGESTWSAICLHLSASLPENQPFAIVANLPECEFPNPDFRQIDSWIVHPDNTATFYVGKTDPGQGTGTGFRQLMSDELDIAFDKTTCIMGSTDITVDQIGSGGSTAMERDSWPMRRVAAEARRVLLDMGSSRLGVPVDQLGITALLAAS